LFAVTGVVLLLAAAAMQLLAVPLKKRWHQDLRGWIT
jgi:hypothetical protein